MTTKHFIFSGLLAACVFLPLSTLSAQSLATEVTWKTVGDDLEVAELRVWPDAFLSTELLLIRTSLKKYRIGVVRALDYGRRTASVGTLVDKSRAVLGINANFFDEHSRPLGVVISNGNFHQDVHKGGNTLTGIFQRSRRGPSIIHRGDFSSKKISEAIQAGPRILTNKKAVTVRANSNAHSRRSGVCIDEENRVVFFITSGMLGVTIPELQTLLRLPEIACKDALNLDGGGSSQLFLSDAILEANENHTAIHIKGSDDVPVILGLFVR